MYSCAVAPYTGDTTCQHAIFCYNGMYACKGYLNGSNPLGHEQLISAHHLDECAWQGESSSRSRASSAITCDDQAAGRVKGSKPPV